MNVLFKSDTAAAAVSKLDALISEFDRTNRWQYRCNSEDMRTELDSRGYYMGMTDRGHYIVLNLDALRLLPSPEYEDEAFAASESAKYAIVADHSEPRQSVFYVTKEGAVVTMKYSKADALLFIVEATGADYDALETRFSE